MGPQSEPRVSGYTVEELAVPNFWKTLLHPADRDRVLAEDEWSDRNLEPWRTNYRIVARGGRTVWVRDEAFLVYDDTGAPRYWQGVVFNVTDRMLAQLEATRRLHALDELKDTFLSAVSHELRTPLTTVLGTCATLERAGGRLSEETRAELLRGVASGARRLDRLLTDLIDLERLGWGAVTLERQPVDLAPLLERVAARWRGEGPWPLVSAATATVWVDADKVERIVEELLANAAKHPPPGTPVWVRARPSYSPGLGIGLSLVLRLAELHGGRRGSRTAPGAARRSASCSRGRPADPGFRGSQPARCGYSARARVLVCHTGGVGTKGVKESR
jgi:PAS domain S-box-containing protein